MKLFKKLLSFVVSSAMAVSLVMPAVANEVQNEENGVVILEAIIPMFVPARKRVKEAIDKIGKVNLAKFQYCQSCRK